MRSLTIPASTVRARLLRRSWAPLLRWIPCVALAAWLIGDLAVAPHGVEVFHVALAGALAALVWVMRGLWPLGLVFALLLLPMAWHFTWRLPVLEARLPALVGSTVRVAGTIRERWSARIGDAPAARVLLGEAEVFGSGERWPLAEVEVELPAPSAWTFQTQRQLRVGGELRSVARDGHRLRVVLDEADHHFPADPVSPWSTEALRLKLRDRSAYYLSRTGQAVYLPLVLDLRDRQSPEGREVITAFRRAGVSHLFAISGINVAMIFALLMLLQRYVILPLQPGQGWVHARSGARLGIIALIWAYIALIGFSPPAVRAAPMGSMLIWSDLWGTRTPGLYVLCLAGLAMLSVQPSQIYDISFQLSFLAYFFLVVALQLGRRVPAPTLPAGLPLWKRWPRQWGYFAALNLLLTLIITVGLWPLIVGRFGNLSLLVFAGNLLLVPLMEVVLLPSAMVALVVTLAYLGAAPGAWLERLVFGWLEAGLWLWLAVVHALNRVGSALVFKVHLDWPMPWVLAYYAALAAALWAITARRKGAPLPAQPAAAEASPVDASPSSPPR